MCTLSEAAELLGVSRQAIYVAISKGRIKAKKNENGKYAIDYESLDEYRNTKHKRSIKSFLLPELLDKNVISLKDAAKQLNVKEAHLYYLIRENRIKAIKTKGFYVFELLEIINFKQKGVNNE